MTAEREAPMPPVFMHSSTMMHLRVFLTLLVMASRSKGFKLIKSMTYIQIIAESRAEKLCLFDVQMLRQWGKSAIEQQALNLRHKLLQGFLQCFATYTFFREEPNQLLIAQSLLCITSAQPALQLCHFQGCSNAAVHRDKQSLLQLSA